MSPSKYSLQEKPEIRILVLRWRLRSEAWRSRAEIRSNCPWRGHGDIRYPKQIARRNGRGEETIGALKFGYRRAIQRGDVIQRISWLDNVSSRPA